jgi:hypothetical protein
VVFYFSGHQHDPAGWVKALAMERETYKRRAKYQRRGVLGDLGSLGTKLRVWCSRLTGIDPVAPDAVLLNEPFFD